MSTLEGVITSSWLHLIASLISLKTLCFCIYLQYLYFIIWMHVFNFCNKYTLSIILKFLHFVFHLFIYNAFITVVLISSSCQGRVPVVIKLHNHCLVLGVRTGDGSCYSSIHRQGQNEQKQRSLSRSDIFTRIYIWPSSLLFFTAALK